MINFRTLIAEASDYDEFTGSGAEKDAEALHHFETMMKNMQDPELSARLRSLQKSYKILVVAEMWCPDCHRNVPAIQFITRLAPDISLSIITREQAGPDFLAHFRLEKIRIPYVIVLNSQCEYVGHFIERPQGAADEAGNLTDSYREGRMLTDTVREIADILFRAEEKVS